MAIYTRAQQKHDIEANWIKAINFIPLEGEIIIYDADENYSYQRIKIGDGITKVNDLPFDNIQGDWNQNDETSPDYIKNRTHYEMDDVETHIDLGEVIVNVPEYGTTTYGNFANTLDIDIDSLVGKVFIVTIDDSTTYQDTLKYGLYMDEHPIYYLGDYMEYLDGRSADFGLLLNTTNISICADFESLNVSPNTQIKVNISYIGFQPGVKQLDEKYIPDTIARKSDVETAVNSLVDTAPEALDTLNELSKALGDDPNFSTTVLTEIGKKVDKVNGKRLSTNDYTTVEKNKLAGIEAGAQKNILGDWNQNDKTAANYIRNRTHYIEENKTELASIRLDGYKTYSGSTGAEEWKITTFLNQEEENTLRALLNDNDCYLEYSSSAIGYYSHKICNCSSNDPSREFTITLEDGYEITIGFGPEAEIPFNSPDQLPETLKTTIELFNDDTWEGGFDFAVRIFQKEKIQKLDSKFLPIPSDCFQPIDLFRKLNITSSSAKNWPISDEDIVNYLNQGSQNYWVKENLFTQLFDLFKNYPGFLPTFIISPPKTDKGGIYQLICSTERIELDSYGATGSPTHPDFNFTYLINLSKDNYLELRFNYDRIPEYPLDLDNLNPDLDNVFLTFSLIPKGGNITTEQVAKLAQEQIITPILTKEEF